MCCKSLPGVQIMIFTWSTRFFSNFKSFPPIINECGLQINYSHILTFLFKIMYIFQVYEPITNPAENSWFLPTLRKTSKIWYANSRVGVIMIAPKPSLLLHRLVYSFSSTYVINWKRILFQTKSVFKGSKPKFRILVYGNDKSQSFSAARFRRA